MTDHATPRLGKVMTYACWLVLLGLLTLFFQQWLDRAYKPNRNLTAIADAPRAVVLKRSRNTHYVAPGTINGEPVEFLLDTGATLVSVPEAIAERLKLRRGPAFETSTANGTVTMYATLIAEITLGNIVKREVRASINPHMHEDTVLLGMSFMKDLELTQRGDELTLRDP